MSKTAVIYYSMTGNTEYVAKEIEKNLNVDIIKINPIKEYPNKGFKKFFWGGKSAVMKETPELEKYDFNENKYENIIIGTPVWASTFSPPIRSFINENKDKLKNKNISIIICNSGGGADKTIEKLRQYLDIKDFKEKLVLVDPKDKEENINIIKEFCNKIG